LSEVNNQSTEQELNEQIIEDEIDDAVAMTVPIDDTLSISGEAADAKAVGDALAQKADKTAVAQAVGGVEDDLDALARTVAQKADKSELQTAVTVNGQAADAQGLILLDAEHVPISDGASESVAGALYALDGKTGEDIPVRSGSAQSIAQALQAAGGRSAEEIPMSESDTTTVAEAIAEKLGQEDIDTGLTEAGKAADAGAVGTALDGIRQELEEEVVRSVNGIGPTGTTGNVELTEVENAHQLISSRNNEVAADFLVRPAGGYGDVSDGTATLVRIEGRQRHDGYVAEVLEAVVNAIPRPVPASIAAELNVATFESYVVTAGTYTLTYTTAWSADPALYGVTVAGAPIADDEIRIYWDGENDPVMTVIAAEREADPEITVTLDKNVFRAYVADSATITLYYTTGWSEDPTLYGLTISNTPVGGDSITINYTKLDRGSITTATPTQIKATGWNLYDPNATGIRVCRYSEIYGYRIGGSYTAVAFALTENGTQQAITPDAGGLFMIPADGWLFVEGGDEDTFLYTTWSDWISDYGGEFAEYEEHAVSLAGVMSNFPAGLMQLGDAADEIDFDTQKAISRVQRLPYTDAAWEAAQASGRDCDADTNYIYIVRATPISYDFEIEPMYTVNEHGLEIVDGSAVGIGVTALYGPNLRDKLERSVVTKEMTVAELKALSL